MLEYRVQEGGRECLRPEGFAGPNRNHIRGKKPKIMLLLIIVNIKCSPRAGHWAKFSVSIVPFDLRGSNVRLHIVPCGIPAGMGVGTVGQV